MKKGHFLALIGVIAAISSCVPARQLEESKTREKTCQEENTRLKDDNRRITTELNELKERVENLTEQVGKLAADTTNQGMAYRRLNNLYENLTESYDKLLANNDRLLAGNSEETKKLINQLSKAQEDLQRKEDRMRKDSMILADKQSSLDSLKSSLEERNERVRQLESIIGRSDSTVSALRKAVSDALLGFENKGLTIQQKGSRVYVSMDEQLLFSSGSTIVEKKGEEALKKLAEVLSQSSDINIMVEGHTDDIPISGKLPSGATDNWELSVLRATSVVKIILKGSTIDPNRITACGKGPYQPIDTAKSSDARK
ncbi:MAG: OmpA family protein, partial [Bacteroidota bacterium]